MKIDHLVWGAVQDALLKGFAATQFVRRAGDRIVVCMMTGTGDDVECYDTDSPETADFYRQVFEAGRKYERGLYDL